MTEKNKVEPFLWASGASAKKEEPIESLRQNGWRAGDVPAASNFNWLFHNIQKQMVELNNQVTDFKVQFEKLKTDIAGSEAKVNGELAEQKEAASKIQKRANLAAIRSIRNTKNIEFSVGISRQICQQLDLMEKNIAVFVPGFPTNHPWPMK